MGRGLVYATLGVLRLCYPGKHTQQSAQRTAHPRYHDRHTKPAPLRRHRGAAKKAKASNKIIYGGAKIAGWKGRGYPHIPPLDDAMWARRAFDTTLAVASNLSWQIVVSLPS